MSFEQFFQNIIDRVDVISTLIAVVVGGAVTFWFGKRLQDRQFDKEKRERIKILKCYLETLKTEIENDFRRLINLRPRIQNQGYPADYFDTSVEQIIISEIIKTKLYSKHKEIFDRINSIITCLKKLNNETALMRDYIKGKYVSTLDQKSKIRQQAEHSGELINEILDRYVKYSGDKPEICLRLKEVVQVL